MTVLIGTAAWADPSLIGCGRFYPPDCRTPEARLRFYATQFPLVEVDSSFYAMPRPEVAHQWAQRTPEGFTFNVKAFRLFTGHATPPQALDADLRRALGLDAAPGAPPLYYPHVPGEIRDELWRRFEMALEPLRQASRLGLVHFQYAPWVRRNRAGLAHVRVCAERLADAFTVSTEFRHRSWFDGANANATLALQHELGLVHTVVDEPQGFDNSVPPVWAATRPDVALVRLHGRNARTWNAPAGSRSTGRFDHDYQGEELLDLSRRIRTLAEQVVNAHVVFNNNHEDQGQRNGRTLRGIMQA